MSYARTDVTVDDADVRALRLADDRVVLMCDVGTVTLDERTLRRALAVIEAQRETKPRTIGDAVRLSNKGCPRYYGAADSDPDAPDAPPKRCGCPKGACWYDAQRARRARGEPALEIEAWLADEWRRIAAAMGREDGAVAEIDPATCAHDREVIGGTCSDCGAPVAVAGHLPGCHASGIGPPRPMGDADWTGCGCPVREEDR